MEIYLIVQKWSHVWHVGVGRKNFHQVSNVWWHWWQSRSQISHEPSDIILTCKWVCKVLNGPACSECFPVGACDFEPPQHVPRTSARAHICALVFRRAPCVPRSREHEKRPAAGREKNVNAKKHIYTSNIYIGVRLHDNQPKRFLRIHTLDVPDL